jgi:hypothetical protein
MLQLGIERGHCAKIHVQQIHGCRRRRVVARHISSRYGIFLKFFCRISCKKI